jgi:esterase/lipase superfamily enzyme
MQIHVTGWYSPATGHTMPLIRYGDIGRPLVLFGTGAGDVLDVERSGLIGAVRPFVESGRVRVYASVSAPPDGPRGWPAYARWFAEELLPSVRFECGDALLRVAAGGVGDGAVFALRLGLSRPDLVWLTAAIGGRYASDDGSGLDTPLAIAAALADGARREWLLRSFFHLQSIGRSAETEALAAALAHAGVPHHADRWIADPGGPLLTAGKMLAASLDRFA